jgi:P27 family predicted phage terminase small subunit
MPTQVKSDELHWLQGTKSQAKAKAEYSVEPGRPKYPKGISAEARAVFKRLCTLLESRRALSEGDGELLRLYALIYDRHAKALAKLAEQGEVRLYTRLDSNGAPHDMEKPNLWLKIAETAEKNLVACLDRLGLSPMNRGKIAPTARATKSEAEAAASADEAFDDYFVKRKGPATEFRRNFA